MIVEFTLSPFDDEITSATIVLWRKDIGATVDAGEILLEVMTEKVNIEIPCSIAGRIIELCGSVDTEVKVGDVLARIEVLGGTSAEDLVSDGTQAPTPIGRTL